MKTIRLAFLISILAIFVCSCSKTGVQDKFLLSDEMKNQNPFMGGEKLYYLTDSLEHIEFKVNERNNIIHEVPYGVRTNMWDLFENDKTFISSDNNGSFLLDMRYIYGYFYEISYRFGTQSNSFTFKLPLNKNNTDHLDSLKVLEQWYYDVFISEYDTTDIFVSKGDTIEDYAYKLYYSTQSGIIKLDFLDDKSWQLEKIEW